MAAAVLAIAAASVTEVVADLVDLLLGFLGDVSNVSTAAVLTETAAAEGVVAALFIELHKLARLAATRFAATRLAIIVVVVTVLGFLLALESGASVVLSVTESALVAVLALLVLGPVEAVLALFLFRLALLAGCPVPVFAVVGGAASVAVGSARLFTATSSAAAGAGVIWSLGIVTETAVLASTALAVVTEVVADGGGGGLRLAVVLAFDVLALALVTKHTLSTLEVAANLLGDVTTVAAIFLSMSKSATVTEVALLVLVEVVTGSTRA